MQVQLKLLRVLQEKEVTMIGSQKARKVDIRIVAATNSDLLAMTKNGSFREDLYYRLNVVNLVVPPLRERRDDIPLLANAFVRKFAREFKKPQFKITDKAMEVLMRYPWPGNVRELENTVQRSLIMADDAIDIAQLPAYLKLPAPAQDLSVGNQIMTLADMEKQYILKVLAMVGNNKTKAAEVLGIDRKTLRLKIG
jgi:two-component system response regulator HydG